VEGGAAVAAALADLGDAEHRLAAQAHAPAGRSTPVAARARAMVSEHAARGPDRRGGAANLHDGADRPCGRSRGEVGAEAKQRRRRHRSVAVPR
jgi:hypothetical protein